MTNIDQADVPIEVEAKFLGGEVEYGRIVEWLERKSEAGCELRPAIHRIHVYFDSGESLRRGGCRLRCVIAAGEWCRYDFKVDDPSGRDETMELSIKRDGPMPLGEVIDEFLTKLPKNGAPGGHLASIRDSARVVLVLAGTHHKAMARCEGVEVEVSWDTLVPLESGIPLSEVEVELLAGERVGFDALIHGLSQDLGLTVSHLSKYERVMAATRKTCEQQ